MWVFLRRSFLKFAFFQLPESMKDSQADLYLETYQVLDIEIGRLREIQRWQSSAAFKVRYPIHIGCFGRRLEVVSVVVLIR